MSIFFTSFILIGRPCRDVSRQSTG